MKRTILPLHPVEMNELLLRLPPVRPADAHKYSFGRLQIIAGSTSYPGAARLCALGAFKAGCGYVTLQSDAPLAILQDLPEIVLGFFAQSDAFVLGPGFDSSCTASQLATILEQIPKEKPILMDGSALKHFKFLELSERPIVLTPHEGEFQHIMGSEWTPSKIQSDRALAVASFAELYPAMTLLLKGSASLIYSSGRVWSMNFGSVAMATAGQGDLLSGVIGAYLALGMSVEDALVVATSLCALTALELSKNAAPQGVLAHEVAQALPAVLAKLKKSKA